jgi:ApeA N-terminal domain 1
MLTDDAPFRAEIKGQLFGAGIHQQDMPAERRTRPNGTPLVPLFTLADAPSLADLIRTWRSSLGERTATALYRLSMDPTLPPPVRYLLCAQALESLHAEDHAEQEESEDEAYDRERIAASAALTAIPDNVLDPSIKRFLKRNVRRKPLRSLASRLHHILGTIPDYDALVGTWTERTQPLVPHLASLDYRTEPLAERLGSIRNVLSHGSVTLPDRPVHAASQILETLLRGKLLMSLGFNNQQLVNAYTGMTNAANI